MPTSRNAHTCNRILKPIATARSLPREEHIDHGSHPHPCPQAAASPTEHRTPGLSRHVRSAAPAQPLPNLHPVVWSRARAPSATPLRRPRRIVSTPKREAVSAALRGHAAPCHVPRMASLSNVTVAAAATMAATTACLGAVASRRACRSVGGRRHLRDVHLHVLLRRQAVVKGLGKDVHAKNARRPPEARQHTRHVGRHAHGGVGAPRLPRLGKHRDDGVVGESEGWQQSKNTKSRAQQGNDRAGRRSEGEVEVVTGTPHREVRDVRGQSWPKRQAGRSLEQRGASWTTVWFIRQCQASSSNDHVASFVKVSKMLIEH